MSFPSVEPTSRPGAAVWRYFKLLIGAILLGVVLVFATQNADPVTVHFFTRRFELSLSLLLFLDFVAGMVVGAIVNGWLRWSRSHRRSR